MNGSNLADERGVLFFIYFLLLLYIQMSECKSIDNTDLTYYQRNKERIRLQARDKYRNLSEEEKNKKKREYGKNRYHIMSIEKKQRLKEYQKKYQKLS